MDAFERTELPVPSSATLPHGRATLSWWAPAVADRAKGQKINRNTDISFLQIKKRK